MAYGLYPPLYIAGPIMTFNDFLWQVCFLRASSEVSGMADSARSFAPLRQLAYEQSLPMLPAFCFAS